MAIGSFSVNPAQVQMLAESIRHGADGIRQQLEDLDNKVSHLKQQWDGSAQQAYAQAQQNWNRNLAEVKQILGNIATATSEISNGYSTSDQRAAGFFG